MSGKILRLPIILLLAFEFLLGCTTSGESPEIDLTFDGEKCTARGPDFIDVGDLIVDLDKQADGVVVVYLYRLDQGKTWSDLVDHYGPAGTFALPPEWVKGMSGRDVGGDKYDRQYDLDPGIYGIVCMFMGPETNGTSAATSVEVRQASGY